jgi:hypothetical protein
VLELNPFLTAYDPSDLPGGSLDPMGFDRGYQYLAESLLPGLTNVASIPRYFAVVCTGVLISDEAAGGGETARETYARRRKAVQHLERLWALACVQASRRSGGELPASGVRGLRYVERELERLGTKAETLGDYKLLARQIQYGVLGIYSSVAERLHLVSDELALHPELGRRLAAAFEEETALPKSVRRCLLESKPVGLDELASWGERAHHSRACGVREAEVLRMAFELNPIRSRMGELLAQRPRVAGEPEVQRLKAIADELGEQTEHESLRDALLAVDAYERCFRGTLLAFQALIHRVERGGALELQEAANLPGVEQARAELQTAGAWLDRALTGSVHLQPGSSRWMDALLFVRCAAAATTSEQFVLSVLNRHRDVQNGKFDRGRRKTPWLELKGTAIYQTLSEAQAIRREPTSVSDVAGHEYRTWAAERLMGTVLS